MDGASWSARWPPPAPASIPTAQPPPPPGQQVDGAALRHLLHPFGGAQQAATAVPEQPVAHPWSSQSAVTGPSNGSRSQPAVAGPSNGSLPQVPGSYSTVGDVPDLRAMFEKLSASNAAMVDRTRASPLGGLTPRHGLPASSSNEQSSFRAQFLNKSANGTVAFSGAGSGNQGVTRRGIQFQDANAHTLQMRPFKSTPHHSPAPLVGRIRVSCLNTGGELFMGGSGLFGVICSCHQLRMSIAKFCEHAGGAAEKAGEIVYVENGMNISQWFKFCTGVGGSIADTKWDWPEWACGKNSPEEHRLKGLPSRNNSIGQLGLLSGYGNITEPLNKQVYSSDLYTEGRGCSNVEKLVKRPDKSNYKKGIDMHGAFTNNSALVQSSMTMNLSLDKNHKDHELDLSRVVTSSGSLNSKARIGNNYDGNHLAYNYGILVEKNFDVSSRNHGPSSTGVLNHDSRVCRPDVSHKTLQDSVSNASNTELKLGQASYHQSMSTLFPSVQSAVIEFQKPQPHAPLLCTNPGPKQTTIVNRSVAKQSALPFFDGNKKQSHEGANSTKHSEGDAFTDGTTNNSLISLFLSHLERNSAPEPIDDILNSEHYLPKPQDGARGSDRPKIASGQIETRDNDYRSKLTPSIIRMKGRSEGISLSAASSGYNPQAILHANSQEPLICGGCHSHFLSSQPNTGIPKICAAVSCPTNCRSCTHVGDKSHHVACAEIGGPCFNDKMASTRETLECVADLCGRKRLKTLAKTSYENGKCCCSKKLLPSLCQNDHSKMEKSICGRCSKIQEDISNLGFRPGHMCKTQFSGDDFPVLASKCTLKGLDELCTCGSYMQRSTLCSGEHILQSSCYACPVDGFHCRSSMGHTIDNLTKNTLFDALNMKERSPCCRGSCCYSVVPKCLPGCGFTKHCGVRIDHTIPGCKHQLQMQMPARCSTLGEDAKSATQCLSNRIAGGSISQSSFQKDDSNEVTNQPSVAITEKLKNVSEASVAGSSCSKSVTEKKGAYRDAVVSKGQPKFGLSSGPSSVVVTKFLASPEFKNMPNKRKNLCDEVSRMEQCSVSSYVPTSTRCEKALNGLKRVPGSHLGPPIVKRRCNQISDGSRLEDSENEEHCFGIPKKNRTLRCSAKHSESEDCTSTSSQSSQNGDSQPQNEGTSFSRRVFRTKQKYATMHKNKPVKRLHRKNKISKRDDEKQDEKVNFFGGISTSDKKRQVEDVITQDITEQHEGTRMFARKLPKYVSLNCIVNEPKSEDACSESDSIDSTVIATGIANDNRKSPKIFPLNLILKKAKRCRAVKPICKADSMHLLKKKSSDCSVDSSDCSAYKSSVGVENCSTQAEDEMQVPQKKPKNRRGNVSLNRIKRHENLSKIPACSFSSDEDNAMRTREVNATSHSGWLSSEASCCVCGILNLEPCNQMIECSKCYIKVHQGCYGILKVPRGQWLCRPCKANTRNTVCVLCGYGGGAMTRALKHKNILKCLLKGLTMPTGAKRYIDSFDNTTSECTNNARGDEIISTEDITSNSWTSFNHDSCLLRQQKTQWVHVVCGLWTPGTKCPNATTMSAFDVSGASTAKRNTACSLCCRTGGSFIKCRDVKCSVLFHPWCGHQRGLLQSEPEGEHNENVGFYGRCLDHAIDLSYHVNTKKECLRSNNWTCARTEGFKGRKGEVVNHKTSESYCGEFSVSHEQINAWLHINGSKSCGRGQMEYTHCKQLKGRKHLVVYKSGIHGLGLYTSVFISRGSKVVEYVGEIVGQRVADKREIEYQSGKRQQYKSACYFFKIDREHIIDATRKGGIARFVNHSCQPNCVAKIISVRNEKKVVFFAERHINPGEEITYDYHFNREDEGQRIPCFCRSRYCRRYLN